MKKYLLMYLSRYGWRDKYEGERFVNPYDYKTEEEFLKAKREFCAEEEDEEENEDF